ncbi:MAG TPA: beta-glucosidase, partial [Allosphingosinicella sp.]|nr:beta-glucosidase [Allosphingosinicella sp.]
MAGRRIARRRIGRALILSALGAAVLVSAAPERPLYKDPSQPVERRVEDLLGRMTLEEKVAQMLSLWEHKDRIQTAAGDFSADKATQAFPN